MNNQFCCQAAEKLYYLTDPDADISSEFVGYCVLCGYKENYTYWVPESLWRKIVPKNLWNEIVCAKCFHNLAQRSRYEQMS